jgi:uncharacterized membrane protein (DUF4010 family)
VAHHHADRGHWIYQLRAIGSNRLARANQKHRAVRIVFVAIQVAVSLGQKFLGSYGTVAISVLGGLASSASTTAAAASLARHGNIAPDAAALATVLTSIASAAVNLPILYRATGDSQLLRKLIGVSVLITTFGLIVPGIVEFALRPR